MASSPSMDDKTFSERVKNTIGSLFASQEISPASLSNPLWSLTGARIEKQQWRPDKHTSDRDSNPCSFFDEFLSEARKNSRNNFKNYRKELQDDLPDFDYGDEDEKEGGDEYDSDAKFSIGLDSTLDDEVIINLKFNFFLGCLIMFCSENFWVFVKFC